MDNFVEHSISYIYNLLWGQQKKSRKGQGHDQCWQTAQNRQNNSPQSPVSEGEKNEKKTTLWKSLFVCEGPTEWAGRRKRIRESVSETEWQLMEELIEG